MIKEQSITSVKLLIVLTYSSIISILNTKQRFPFWMASCEITAIAAKTSRCTLISCRYTCFKIFHCLNHILIVSCREQTLCIICCFPQGLWRKQAISLEGEPHQDIYHPSLPTQMDPNVMQEMIKNYPGCCRLLVDGAHWSSKSPHLKLTG